MRRNTTECVARSLGLPAIMLVLATLMVVAGCQEAPLPGETYRKKAVAFPIFDFEKTAGVNDDGTRWEKEKGDAVCWLSTWEKERVYDAEGTLISLTERDGFFPLWSTEIVETVDYRHRKGSVLLFPHESYRRKTPVTPETP